MQEQALLRWIQCREIALTRLLSKFLKDETAATSIEYALLASGIALAIITVVRGLGTTVATKYDDVNQALK